MDKAKLSGRLLLLLRVARMRAWVKGRIRRDGATGWCPRHWLRVRHPLLIRLSIATVLTTWPTVPIVFC